MNKIVIERTTERGYETGEYTFEEAIVILNKELESRRTIFIDGSPWYGDFINENDIKNCKKEISVTNQLVGG